MDKIISRSTFLGAIDPAAVLSLKPHLVPVTFAPRHRLFAEGELAGDIYFIGFGAVAISQGCPDGRTMLQAVLGPSDMFGDLAVIESGLRTVTATTITWVRAMSVDGVAFRAWIAAHPEVARQMLLVLAGRVRRVRDDLANLTFTDVAGRTARMLLDLGALFGTLEHAAVRVRHGLSQVQIAQLVGATRETVNKVLMDFTDRGWIAVERKMIWIYEPDSLARRARGATADPQLWPDPRW